MSSAEAQQVIEEKDKDRDLDIAMSPMEEENESVEYLREVLETQLHPGTAYALLNYLGKDFLLSNLGSDDFNELKWLFRIRVQRFIWHRPREDGLCGDDRAFAYDDETAALPALDRDQRAKINAFKDAVIGGRLKRGEDGFQFEQMNRTIKSVERRDTNEADSGRSWGMF